MEPAEEEAKREYLTNTAIARATDVADTIIMDAAGGDFELLLGMTNQLARRFVEKTAIMIRQLSIKQSLLQEEPINQRSKTST